MSDRYKLDKPGLGVAFEVDRLRRDRHELFGELSVRCSLPGAKTVNGLLTTGDFNFSSVRARTDRAKLLKERAQTNGSHDWFALIEEFTQRVFEAERDGDPSVDLRSLARPERGDEIKIGGLVFPRRHPSILFGDGGAAKSYFGLFLASHLARQGFNVALFDWELSGADHRHRLELLCGTDMPMIHYCRCERPLTVETDRLRRVVRDHQIDYAIYDSVAFACGGRPEDAEVAGEYFRAVRQIDCGSLHIAHINKSETSDQKPFGSAFWSNGARSTWFVEAAERAGDATTLQLGFFNRKSNLGALCAPTSYTLNFTSERTIFTAGEISEDSSLTARLTTHQRMFQLLRRGSMLISDIALEIDAKAETIERTARRFPQRFIVLSGNRVGLVQK